MKVILSGDWHIGLEGTLDEEIIYDLAGSKWKGKPVLLLGDLVDLGLYKGMNFENKFHPQPQYDKALRILELLDVRAYVIGNHEHRVFAAVGLNPYYSLLGKIKHEVVIDNTSFYLFHGKSNAENIFLEHSRLMRFICASVVAAGHNHALAKLDVLQNGSRVTWLRTGSFVDSATYAVDMGLPPRIAGWVEYDTYTAVARLFTINKEGQVSEI